MASCFQTILLVCQDNLIFFLILYLNDDMLVTILRMIFLVSPASLDFLLI